LISRIRRRDGVELTLQRFESGIDEAAALAFLEFLARQFDGRHSLADVDRPPSRNSRFAIIEQFVATGPTPLRDARFPCR